MIDAALSFLPSRTRSRPQAFSKVISPKTLEAATALVREGKTVKAASIILAVPLSTLTAQMLKHGLSVKNIRPRDLDRDRKLSQAVSEYKNGILVAVISRNTGIPEKTLHSHFRRRGLIRRPRRRPKVSQSSIDNSAAEAEPLANCLLL